MIDCRACPDGFGLAPEQMPSNPKTKERIMRSFTDADEEAIKEEVKEQFNQLVSAINQSNASAWAEYYSKAGFLSAIAGIDHYATRVIGWIKERTISR